MTRSGVGSKETQRCVCAFYGESVADIFAAPDKRTREQRPVWIRSVVYWCLITHGMSQHQAARELQYDRGTIANGIESVQHARDTYPLIKHETDTVLAQVKAS